MPIGGAWDGGACHRCENMSRTWRQENMRHDQRLHGLVCVVPPAPQEYWETGRKDGVETVLSRGTQKAPAKTEPECKFSDS